MAAGSAGRADLIDDASSAAFARLYDLDLVEDPGDTDLYLALAERAGGRVLELASGTGRLAVPIAMAGNRVTAVDLDPAMLERGRTRAAAMALGPEAFESVEANLLTLRLGDAGRFSLAFIALNSLMLLGSRDAQRQAVRVLADHLAPGGIAVVDVWLPDADDLGRFDGRSMLEWVRTDPQSGALVSKTGSATHDAATGTIALTTIFEEGRQGEPSVRWVRTDRLRLVSADELAAFAVEAGLEVEILAGGYGLEPLGPGSERVVLVAVRA